MEEPAVDVEVAAHVLEVRDDFRQVVAAPAVDAAHLPGPPGLRACFPVETMRDQFYEMREPLWTRLLEIRRQLAKK